MESAEFDKFAEEYKSLHAQNIAASGEGPEYFAEYKMKDLSDLVKECASISDQGNFLDFGAGVGASIPYFNKFFPAARLTCLDVSQASLEIAKANHAGAATFTLFDGGSLPFADNSFDAAYAACVFHHIPHAEHERLLRELRRVLKVGGKLMVYEHNPYNPLTTRAVNSCAFDENAVLIPASKMNSCMKLAGYSDSQIRYRVFFPRILSRLRWMEHRLTWLPLGAQYYVAATK